MYFNRFVSFGAVILTLFSIFPALGNNPNEIFNLAPPIIKKVSTPSTRGLGATSVVVGKEGYVWLGSPNGLFRFDGYHFKKFAKEAGNENSLIFNDVRRLFVADNGNIIVGTYNGLSVLNPKTGQFTNYFTDAINPDSQEKEVAVYTIERKTNNIYWVGTSQGLMTLNISTHEVLPYKNKHNIDLIAANDIRALLVDNQSNLWVGTKAGLFKLNKESSNFLPVHANTEASIHLGGKIVQGLFQSADGNVWVATQDQGAVIVSPNTEDIRLASSFFANHSAKKHIDVELISQPFDDEIWIGNYGGGITVLDADTFALKQHLTKQPNDAHSLRTDDISDIVADRHGGVWISTFSTGLYHYSSFNKAFRLLKNTNGENGEFALAHAFSLLQPKESKLWVGTFSQGINILDLSSGKIAKAPSAIRKAFASEHIEILSMLESVSGEIWIATNRGVFHYKPKSGEVKEYLKDIRTSVVFEDNQHRIWVKQRYEGNFVIFDPTKLQFEHAASFKNDVLNLTHSANGKVYFSTRAKRVYQLDTNSFEIDEIYSSEKSPDMMASENFGLFVDKQGVLHLSHDNGIDRLVSWDGKSA